MRSSKSESSSSKPWSSRLRLPPFTFSSCSQRQCGKQVFPNGKSTTERQGGQATPPAAMQTRRSSSLPSPHEVCHAFRPQPRRAGTSPHKHRAVRNLADVTHDTAVARPGRNTRHSWWVGQQLGQWPVSAAGGFAPRLSLQRGISLAHHPHNHTGAQQPFGGATERANICRALRNVHSRRPSLPHSSTRHPQGACQHTRPHLTLMTILPAPSRSKSSSSRPAAGALPAATRASCSHIH